MGRARTPGFDATMGIKSRQRRRQQTAGRANSTTPRGFNPRTGEFDGTGMSQEEIMALYEELAQEERRRARGAGRVRYSEANAVMKLWNGVVHVLGVVVVVFIASFTQLFPTAEAYDRRRGQDPNARFGDDTDGPEGIHGDEGIHDDKPPDTPAKPTDPFETLGLDKTTATVDDVARAFKKMAIKWHPDKNRDGNEEEAVRMMQTVNAARARCVQILEGGVDPEDPDTNGHEFDPTKANGNLSDTDSDDDVGGADHEAKARRRSERAQRKMYEEMQRDYEKRRKQERQRVRSEARQPGARFRRQRDAYVARKKAAVKESTEDGEGHPESESNSEPSSPKTSNRTGKGSGTNRKKNRTKKDKSRFQDKGDDEDDDDVKALGGIESCAERMDACVHEVALAVRAHAPTLLAELLMFEHHPTAAVDDDGNTPLHYVARYDPGLVEAVFQVVGEGWRPCCLARNNHGQLPVDMLSPEVEDLDEATAAHADRVGESAPKGSSPAAVEERERLERRAKERAESSRVGAERIRQITRYALKEEEKRRVLTRRTFDAAGALRVTVAMGVSCVAAWVVLWTGVWGRWVLSCGAFFATAISLLSYLVPQEQVAEFDPRAGGREGEDGAVAGENEDA